MAKKPSTPLPLVGYADAPELRLLPVTQIHVDHQIHPRAKIRPLEVQRLKRLISEGTNLPAPTVFFDGHRYVLADGFHRLQAHANCNTEILVEVRSGTHRDAEMHAITTNARHGFPLTRSEKNRAVQKLLSDSEWVQRSDREIAEACCVSHPTVGKLRKALTGKFTSEEVRQVRSKHGCRVPMRVTRLSPKGEIDPDNDAVPSGGRKGSRSAEARESEASGSGSLPGRGSLQLRSLLKALRGGQSVAEAARTAGISVPEAELHAGAMAKGEYSDVVLIEATASALPQFPCQNGARDHGCQLDQAMASVDQEPNVTLRSGASSIVDAFEALIIRLGEPRKIADLILATDDADARQRFGEFLDWVIAVGERYMTAQGRFRFLAEGASDEF